MDSLHFKIRNLTWETRIKFIISRSTKCNNRMKENIIILPDKCPTDLEQIDYSEVEFGQNQYQTDIFLARNSGRL